MSKKRFIHQVIIRSLPRVEKMPEAIAYAEQLWEALSRHGYGADKQQPRDNKDWFLELNDRQKKWFNGFWQAFNYKHGRNGAAMRWYQLGDMSDGEYQQIIDAARCEAQKQLPPGQARKMAQGWLAEKRWQDYQPVEPDKKQQKNHVITHLNNELNAVRKLYQSSGDAALKTQIQKLEQAINDARR
jgi:hypothetical protein